MDNILHIFQVKDDLAKRSWRFIVNIIINNGCIIVEFIDNLDIIHFLRNLLVFQYPRQKKSLYILYLLINKEIKFKQSNIKCKMRVRF